MKRPSRSEVQSLVEAYAKRIFSVDRAPAKTQQKLYETFTAAHNKLQDRYPNVDLASDAFWRELQAQATTWWWSRPMHGAGTDW